MKRLNLAAIGAIVVLELVSFPMKVSAQSGLHARTAKPASGMTVDDVIRLTTAGLSEDIIIQQIRNKGQAFDLTTDQLIALKSAHVSDRILQCMLDPSKPDLALVPAREPEPRVGTRQAAPVAAPAAVPTEIGVYTQRDGQWVEIPPELVYWKTGGALKSIATVGVMHGDVNGHVLGTSSRTSLATPLRFLIVAPDGVALTEYQLIRFRTNKDNREFRTITGGLLHSQGGAIRDLVSFDGEKLASRVYEVHFPETAGLGEYGILPPGSTSGSGKIYSFRITK